MSPIKNALNGWIDIWQNYRQTFSEEERHHPLGKDEITPDNMWKRVGFSRFCPEYWLLAKLMTERLSATLQVERQSERSLDEHNRHSADPTLLERYDETSMRQVNDLISEFQRVMI